MVNESVVQALREGAPTNASEGDVIAGQIDALEAVALFEVAEIAPLLFPIGEVRVHEVRNTPFGAGPDRVGDERIGWSLVPVSDHRDYVHQASLRSSLVAYELDETNQPLAKKRSDEDAAVEVGCRLLAHGLDILPVMEEWFSLAARTFVVVLPDSLNEGGVERYLPNRYPLLPPFPVLIPIP